MAPFWIQASKWLFMTFFGQIHVLAPFPDISKGLNNVESLMAPFFLHLFCKKLQKPALFDQKFLKIDAISNLFSNIHNNMAPFPKVLSKWSLITFKKFVYLGAPFPNIFHALNNIKNSMAPFFKPTFSVKIQKF